MRRVISKPYKNALQNYHELPQKKLKTFKWPVLPYSFPPIDYSVIKTVIKTQNKNFDFQS